MGWVQSTEQDSVLPLTLDFQGYFHDPKVQAFIRLFSSPGSEFMLLCDLALYLGLARSVKAHSEVCEVIDWLQGNSRDPWLTGSGQMILSWWT